MLYSMSELLLTATPERVLGCELVPEGVRLESASRSLVVDVEPDEHVALRLCRLATRILAVELHDPGSARGGAEVTAVWRRVPYTRSIPLSAALALTRSGVPTYLSVQDR
jgi:hypothetical protein